MAWGLWGSGVAFGELNERTERFYTALLKRPQNSYLFDRFYDVWLETDSVENLEIFLREAGSDDEAAARQQLLAGLYAKLGRNVAALELLTGLTAEDSAAPEVWLQKAQLEARTLDYESALKDLAQAQRAAPNGELAIQITKLQGQLYVRNNERDKALEIWKALLAANADDPYLYEDLIELQIEEGLYDAALETSDALLKITTDPYRRVLYNLRKGDIHQRAGRRQAAVETYTQTLELVGRGSWIEREVLAQIERVFRREDDISGLREYYQGLIESQPDRLEINKRFAAVLNEVGETSAALEQWTQILQKTPGDRGSREEYVHLLIAAEKYTEAEKQYETLIEQYPADAELLMQLAQLQSLAGELDLATLSVQQFVEVAGESESVLLRAARTFEKFENIEAAEGIYDRLAALFPDNRDVTSAKAEFFYRHERKAEAIELWRQMAVGADLAEVLRAAQALRIRGEYDPAFNMLFEREGEFGRDPRYLADLCRIGLQAEKAAEVLPLGRRWIELSQSSPDFEAALTLTLLLAKQSEQIDALVEDLRKAPETEVGARCLLAGLLELQGDSLGADKVLNGLPQHDDRALTQRVNIYKQRHNWERAAETTEQRLALVDGRSSALVRDLIHLYIDADQPEKALAWAPKWKQISPTSTAPWLIEAKIHRLLGQADKALEVLRQGAGLFAEDIDIQSVLADTYAEASQYDDAQRIYWRLFEQASDIQSKLRWIAQIANITEMTGAEQNLLDTLEERQRTNRTSIEPYLALAEAHRVFGNYEERRQALLEATRLRPDDPILLLAIARIEEQEGDYDRAITTLNKARKLDKTQQSVQMLARLYLTIGEMDQAYQLLFEISGGDRMIVTDVEKIGDLLVATRDWPRLVAFLQEQLPRFADNYRLRYLYGVALEENLQPEAAVEAFVRVISATEEPVGHAPQQSPVPWQSYLDELRPIVPAGTLRLMEQSWFSNEAYTYNNGQYSGMSMSMGGSGSGQTVSLPGSLEHASNLALAHLVNLVAEYDDAKREALVQELALAGEPLAEIMFAMPGDFNFRQLPPDVMETYGDNPALAGLWVLMAATAGVPADAELALKYHEKFAKSRPALAYLAACVAVSADQENEPILLEALKAIEATDNPNMFCVMGTARLLGTEVFGMDEAAGQLTEPTHALLTEALLQWYPKLKHTGAAQQYHEYFFMMVFGALDKKDPLLRIHLLEDEIADARSHTGVAVSQMAAMMRSMGGGENLIQPLPMPPTALPEVPMHVIAALTQNGQRFGFPGMDSEWTRQLTKEQLNAVKEPVLKILLAHIANQGDIRDATIKRMLAAETPSLSAYLLAAASAGASDKPGEALDLLNTARYMPMHRDMRTLIDTSIVAYAREIENDKDALTAARDAALRLRRASLPPQQRMELVIALEQLELTEEADQVAEQVNQSTSLQQQTMNVMGMGQSGQFEQLQTLLSEGKREVVVKTLVRQYEQFARALSSVSAHTPNAYQLNHFMDAARSFLEQHKLTQEIIDELRPPENASWRRWLLFANAAELIEAHDEAHAAFDTVLATKPDAMEALVPVSLLVAQDDPNQAAAYLARISPRDLDKAEQMICQRLSQQWEDDPQPVIQGCAALVNWLEHADADQRFHGEGLTDLVRVISGGHWSNRFQIPEIESWLSRPPEYKSEDEVDPAFLAERLDVYERLCRVMLDLENPSAGADGFSRLLSLADIRDEDLEPFVEMAQAVLTRPEKKRVRNSPGQTYYYSSENDSRRTPIEFLVRHAWREKQPELISELIPKIQASGHHDVVRDIELLQAVYTAAPEDFVAAARKYYEGGSGHQRLGPAPADYLRHVVEAWRDREIKASLHELVLEHLKQQAGWGYVGAAEPYVLELAKRGGVSAVNEFFEYAATDIIGPVDQRAEVIAKEYQSNRYSSGTRNAHMQSFQVLLEACVGDERVMFPALAYLELFPDEHGNYRWSVPNQIQFRISQAEQYPDDLLSWLAASPFVAEIDEFRAYPWPGEHIHLANSDSAREISLLELFVYYVKETEPAKKAVQAWLSEQSPQTFGIQLLQAALAAENNAALCEFLGEHLDELKTASEVVRIDLGRFVLVNTVRIDKLSPAAQEAIQLLRDSTQSAEADLYEQIMSARRLVDLKWSDFNVDDEGRDAVRRFINTDVDKAVNVFNKVNMLINDAQRLGNFGVHYSNDSSPSSRILAQSLVDVDSTNAVLFFLRLLRHEQEARITVEPRTFMILGESLRQAVKTASRTKEESDRMCCLGSVCRELAAVAPEGDLTILQPALYEILKKHDREQIQAALAWEPEDPATHRVHQALAMAIRMKLQDDDLAELGEHYMTVLEDESHPLAYRLPIAGFIALHGGPALASLTTSAGIDLLSEAYETKDFSNIEGYADDILKRFRFPDHKMPEYGPLPIPPRDDAWRTHAARVVDAFLRRYRRSSGPSFGGVHYHYSSGVTVQVTEDLSAAQNVLGLALELDRDQDISSLVKNPSLELARNMITWQLLTHYQKYDLARELVSSNVDTVFSLEAPAEVWRHPDFEPRAVEMWSGISDSETRYAAEVVFRHLMSDTDGEDRQAKAFTALAEHFSASTIKDQNLKRWLLLLLVQHETALEVLAPALEETLAHYDWLAMIGSDRGMLDSDNRAQNDVPKLFEAQFRAWLLAGRLDLVEKTLDKLADPDTSKKYNSWRLQDYQSTLRNNIVTYLMNHQHLLDRTQVVKCAALFRKIISRLGDGDLENEYEFGRMATTCHLIAGELSKWQKTVKSLKERRQYAQLLHYHDLWGSAAKYFNQQDPPASFETKLEVLKNLGRDPNQLEYWQTHTLVHEWSRTRFLTKDEMLANYDALIEAAPRDGLTIAEFVNWLGPNATQDITEDVLERAVASQPTGYGACGVAQELIYRQQYERAKALLESIETDDQEIIAKRDQLMERIKRAPSPEQLARMAQSRANRRFKLEFDKLAEQIKVSSPPMAVTERIKLILEQATQPEAERYWAGRDFIAECVKAELLSTDEALEHAEHLATELPRQGLTWAELYYQALKDDQLDKAEGFLDKALAGEPKGLYALRMPVILIRAGRGAEALKILESVEPTDEREQHRREMLLRQAQGLVNKQTRDRAANSGPDASEQPNQPAPQPNATE